MVKGEASVTVVLMEAEPGWAGTSKETQLRAQGGGGEAGTIRERMRERGWYARRAPDDAAAGEQVGRDRARTYRMSPGR
jgi:hypothetical protein